MSQLLRQGWGITKGHTKLVILLFLYQMIWSFLLYRIVNHIVTPIMKRYPDLTAGKDATTLFWMENQFQLLKTDLLVPYMYTLLYLLLARMFITPLLQAGMLHSIHQHAVNGKGTYFRRGIATKWKPMMLLYWLKSIAIGLPTFIYAIPIVTKLSNHTSVSLLLHNLNWKLSLLVGWILFVQLLFYLLQLAVAWDVKVITLMKQAFSHAIAFISVTLVIALLYMLISTGVHTLSVVWVSFISFLLYQLLPLLRSICKIWMIASQYKAIEPEQ